MVSENFRLHPGASLQGIRVGLFSSALVLGPGPLCGLAQAEEAKAGTAITVPKEELHSDKTMLCSDGKSHYVLVLPDPHVAIKLFYGDGKRFYHVPSDAGGMLSGGNFMDPRRYNKTANPSFRGLDMRVFSWVDTEKDTCIVRCGDKTTKIPKLDKDKTKDLLSEAKFERSPQKYRPYALARDDEAIYYYVDRGYHPEEERRFRLFVGPKGNMKEQKMKNVASDSGGDIFATVNGSLRLILDRKESVWIKGKQKITLRVVPVEENLPMIYNDLGLYTSIRLGNPCDDF